LKWQVPREFMRRGRQLFKPQTVLFALAEASAVAEANLAMARHSVQEWF